MIKEVYTQAFSILMKKPMRLWGISLLGGFLAYVLSILFSIPLGLPIAIGMLLEVGLAMVFLHGIRGEEVKAVHLFDCFRDWGVAKRVLCGMGWRALWLFLWCLIPFVGPIFAIIKSYSWYLVPYILAQEPDVAPTEALAVSKQRTDGKKGMIFLAEILPGLIVLIGAAILFWIASLLLNIAVVGILFALVVFLAVLAACLLLPLFNGLVSAAIYEKLTAEEGPAAAEIPEA